MSLVPFARKDARKVWLIGLACCAFVFLIGLGVMAENGWLPRTDSVSGKKTGWFGRESSPPYEGGVAASRGRGGSLAPPTSPTPQLSKEYIYSGARLLAVEDANTNAAPPADLAIWRPGDGNWWILGGPGSAHFVTGWGMNGDIPVAGDYDGDGKTDLAVFRPSNDVWYVIRSSDGGAQYIYFADIIHLVAVGDYDGDGRSDAMLYRPSDGYWFIHQSTTSTMVYIQFGGQTGDQPVPADYDGDGKADLAVWTPSTYTLSWKKSSDGQTGSATLGSSTSKPVPADYDGDGKADPAIFSGSTWTIRYSSTNTTSSITWQSGNGGNDVPVQNDYDGDGKVDIAFWRPSASGYWYIRQSGSSNSLRQVSWGGIINGVADIPVPAYFRR